MDIKFQEALHRVIADEIITSENEKFRKRDEALKSLGRKWIIQAAAVDLERNRFRSIEIELKLQHEAAKLRGPRYGKL